MVPIGSGAEHKMESYAFVRYTCYLIVQNADPSKPVIANGQTYFAIQTRRQELADDEAFKRLKEEEKRLFLRNEMREHNRLPISSVRRRQRKNFAGKIFRESSKQARPILMSVKKYVRPSMNLAVPCPKICRNLMKI